MEWAEVLKRRTIAFGIAVLRCCRSLPRSPEVETLRRQLSKSGTSVGANYRSSCRSRSTAEWRARLAIVVEEADESDYWLTIIDTIDLGDQAERQRLLSEARELTALFAASLRSARR